MLKIILRIPKLLKHNWDYNYKVSPLKGGVPEEKGYERQLINGFASLPYKVEPNDLYESPDSTSRN